MKIIEAMKKVKELQEKSADLRQKIAQHSEDLNFETPVYPDQKKQVREWLQAHSDVAKEIGRLRLCVQRTNIATKVDIELGGKVVNKTIAEWVQRRRELAGLELEAWNKLGKKGLREGTVKQSNEQLIEVKIRRYFDPEERDKMVEMYRTEPGIIDRTLEVVNAVTELIEA